MEKGKIKKGMPGNYTIGIITTKKGEELNRLLAFFVSNLTARENT